MDAPIRTSLHWLVERIVLPLTIVGGVASTTLAKDAIVVWRVGTPFRGDTPSSAVPPAFRSAAARLGFDVTIEAFSAAGFSAVFAEAIARNAAPDVLAFDNFMVMVGGQTPSGRYNGIGEDPNRRSQFIRATGPFEQLVSPGRGWTYLFALSPHHAAAHQMALQAIQCPDGQNVRASPELQDVVSGAATAYFAGDTTSVQSYADPDRLAIAEPSRAPARVDRVTVCSVWGNGKLSIASVDAIYEGATAIGQARAVLVLRRPDTRWRVLVVARDPASIADFVRGVPQFAAHLSAGTGSYSPPEPAYLVAPTTGDYPPPARGQRFGDFVWQPSPSENVVVEIAEFVYRGDVRLIIVPRGRPGAPSRVSAGRLVSAGFSIWRVWSVSRTGEIAFSESRTFVH